MQWNDQRVAELTELWRNGLSASQVARQLGGLTRSAVIGKIHRLGIAGRDAPSRPRASTPRPDRAKIRASAGGALRTSEKRGPRNAPTLDMVCEVVATATLLTLAEHGCRWPIGEPEQPDFGFCGRTRAAIGSYCECHARMALRRAPAAMSRQQLDRMVWMFSERTTALASAEAAYEAARDVSAAMAAR